MFVCLNCNSFLSGPPTPATVNAAPQPHYMPMFIHLPYALPVSSQQPHVPPVSQPPRAQMMRNSPPNPGILPISTAAAAAVASAAPIEAFYQQPPMIVAPQIQDGVSPSTVQTPVSSVAAANEIVTTNHITTTSDNNVEKSNPQVEPPTTDLEKKNVTEIVKTSSEKVNEKVSSTSMYWISQLIARKFKKVQAKKLVKSNKSKFFFREIAFLAV